MKQESSTKINRHHTARRDTRAFRPEARQHDSFSEITASLRSRIPALIARWRGASGTHGNTAPLTAQELHRAAHELLELQRGLTGGRELAGEGYMNRSGSLGAYILYYWPVSYMQAALAAQSAGHTVQAAAQAAEQSSRPVRILDVGCGPAPASAAVLDLFRRTAVFADKFSAEITLCDYSSRVLDVARGLILPPGTSEKRITVKTVQADLLRPGALSSALASAGHAPDSYDIIIMSHVLNELWKDDSDRLEKQEALLAELTGMLSSTGLLCLIEPAQLATSRSLIAMRNRLCTKGYTVVAPCTGQGSCPALTAGAAQTCHAEIMWQPPEPVAGLAAAAGLDRQSVKMCYFIMQKAPLQDGTADGTPEPAAAEISAAVVSDSMRNKAGRIRFILCDGTKRFTLSAPQHDPHAEELGFFTLRRYDRIKVTGAQQRGTNGELSFGITESTQLEKL